MNPHAVQPVSPNAMVSRLWGQRRLILQMAKREVLGRYKGSIMGLLWSFLNPLLMLAIYTFVFSVVFRAKWGGAEGSKTQFAIVLFAGMIVHAFFAEILNRSPMLIISNANYVKKVIFPLESLSVITAVAALFHACASIAVLMVAFLIFNGYVHWTSLFLPLVFAPLFILALGFSWIFCSLGVFARDLGQMVGVLTAVLQFLSPVFFPLSSLPPKLQPWIMLNPLTFIIEETRAVLVLGEMPNWLGLAEYSVFASVFAWVGYVWFQKTRKGFADVL